ncbi:MAG: pyruvate kinase [Acidimicrobiia bacterium]
MARRTKIVATIGPASESPATLAALVAAGMDVARLSLAHGPVEETVERIGRIRATDPTVAILADLPGPKIRSGLFPEGGVHLADGAVLDLVPGADGDVSSASRVVVDHAPLLADIAAGDRIRLGDGAIQLVVTDVDRHRARAEVAVGGWARGRPGVALPPGRTTVGAPTPDDLRLLDALCDAGVDAAAISFVRSAADVARAREAVGARKEAPMLVAKIETAEAVDNLDSIIAAADGVMVARGDLGIRCAIEDVPHHQKRIIRTGVAYGLPVITATQMLESMVASPVPTRAEVSDVANAVFDGTSALMLSAETAIGAHPVASVATMARVAIRAEAEFDYYGWGRSLGRQQQSEVAGAAPTARITAAISAAAWRAAIDAEVVAILACTASGRTARAVSRFRPTVPLLAVTPHRATARKLRMAWGITPVVDEKRVSTDETVWFAVEAAVRRGVAKRGDVVAVVVGSPVDPEPVTDTLRLVRVR